MADLLAPIEVKLLVDENIVKETLSRIGIVNKDKKVLYPSCYLIKEFGSYYIFHFKELFSIMRSNTYNNVSLDDLHRKNSIIFCLKQWKMIDVDEDLINPHDFYIFVLPYREKSQYKIIHKFNVSSLQKENT